MIEFANPLIQELYDNLKAEEDELLDDLQDVQDRIRTIEQDEERA